MAPPAGSPRCTVIDQEDFVAGEGQLVAASGARAVERGKELRPECRLESSIPLRVSLVNLQKFTFQACEDVPSM